MRFHCLTLLVSLIVCPAVLGGCGGSGLAPVDEPTVTSAPGLLATEVVAQEPAGMEGFGFPPPSQLITKLGKSKQVSYTEADLWRLGAAYNPALPHQNVSYSTSQVVLSPTWQSPDNCNTSGLAYCMYDFTIPGFDRNNRVHYHWTTPLNNNTDGWVGLANWADDSWDWYMNEADGMLDLPTLDPYFDASDRLLLVILRIGTTPSTLGQVRIGSKLPVASVVATPDSGLVPLTVSFDGSASQGAEGAITKYEWDWEADGTWDLDSGTDPTVEHTYTSAWDGVAYLRVTAETGLTDLASAGINAIGPWTHTWGGIDTDEIKAIATGNDSIYCVGSSSSFAGGADNSLVLLRYTQSGYFLWARAFHGSVSDKGCDIAIDGNGDIIVVGTTESWGGGQSDILYQKWSPSGELVWSYTWGGSNIEAGKSVVTDGTDIYIAGHTNTYGASSLDIIVLKVVESGNISWGFTWGGDYAEDPSDLVKVSKLFGSTTFRLTGYTSSFGAGGEDVLYLSYTPEGTITSAMTWGNSHDQEGTGICFGALGSDPYVCAYDMTSGSEELILIEATSSGTPAVKRLGHSGEHRPTAIRRSGDTFYVAGRYRDTGSDPYCGMLATVDKSTWDANWRKFSSPSLGAEFSGMVPYSGYDGIFLGGSMEDADGIWVTTYNDQMVTHSSASWQSPTATVTVGVLTIYPTTNPTVSNITNATKDTGGGAQDCALMLTLFD